MRRFAVIVTILGSAIWSGCQSASEMGQTAAVEQTAAGLPPTSTPTTAPRRTPEPTATPTATPTPSPDGRVLPGAYVFTREGSDDRWWVGVVRPGEYELEQFMDGYLFSVGEASKGRLPMIVGGFVPGYSLGDLYYDQQLVLVSLPDLNVQEISPLTPYYPETDGEYFRSQVSDQVLDVTDAVGRSTPVWSPDGRYLAFVAAIEGPSSGIYVYDSIEGLIKLVGTSPNEVGGPSWSPDGRGLVYEELLYRPDEIPALRINPIVLRWAPLTGAPTFRFADTGIPQSWNLLMDWPTNEEFTFLAVPPGATAPTHLSIADVSSGRSSRVAERFGSQALLRYEGTWALLVRSRQAGGDVVFSLIDGATREVLNVDFATEDPFPLMYALDEFGFFLVAAEDVGFVKVLPSGAVEPLITMEGIETVSLSPDGRSLAAGLFHRPQWLFELGPDGSLSEPYELVGEEYIWRPDGQALLLECDSVSTVVAQPPNWTAETYGSKCPAWSGRWINEPSPDDRRPVGILWVDRPGP